MEIEYYCIFCKPGQESKAITGIELLGYKCLAPGELVKKRYNGKTVEKKKRLIPGYVFFEVENHDEEYVNIDWEYIKRLNSVIKILQYEDGSRKLIGSDLKFIEWLKRYGGLIDVSRVIQVGTKIKIVDGPLQYFEGKIIEVKKSRRVVKVLLGGDSIIQTIWCPIEYVEESKTE